MLEWTATALGLLGGLGAAMQYRWCWYVWLVTDALWIAFGVQHSHWGLVTVNVAYSFVCVIGIWRWRRKDKT